MKSYIALDIGGTKIASALVNFDEEQEPLIEYCESVPTLAKEGGAQVLKRAIDSALRVQAAAERDVCAVAVSSAGAVDPFAGKIVYANEIMPGWTGTELGKELERVCGLPAFVINDVHAHALGEVRYGAGKGAKSALVVAVGTGIGGAFVNFGNILLGASSEAGHIGHMCAADAAGVPCPCGGEGHVEPIAAGPGIIEEYLRLGGVAELADGTPVGGAEIDRMASEGNEAACAAEARAGRALGEVIASTVNMLDPEVIILSGSVAKCGPAWSDALEESYTKTAMPSVRTTPRVMGSLADNAPLIGAAAHAMDPAYLEMKGASA